LQSFPKGEIPYTLYTPQTGVYLYTNLVTLNKAETGLKYGIEKQFLASVSSGGATILKI